MELECLIVYAMNFFSSDTSDVKKHNGMSVISKANKGVWELMYRSTFS
jgi:hypothetical protein